METVRRPFQGVTNIIRFNWHFYLLAFVAAVVLLFISNSSVAAPLPFLSKLLLVLLLASTAFSLLISFYIYDRSDLYQLKWLNEIAIPPGSRLVNIHAGFDETSVLLKKRYPDSNLLVFDFYDPQKHTEVSIKRARKLYPAYPGTVSIDTSASPPQLPSADFIFIIFSAHEIRSEKERIAFFKSLSECISDSGKLVVTEHLRDLPNLLAYNIGVFHFYSRRCWYNTFRKAGWKVFKEIKTTPFVTTFILEKNGTAS